MKSIGVLLILFVTISMGQAQEINENQSKAIPPSSQTDITPPPPPPPPPPPDNVNVGRVDEMTRFPGCESILDKRDKIKCAEEKLLEYLYSTVEYPAKALADKEEGMAIVQFVVQKDGSLGNIKCVRDPGCGFGEAAIKAIHRMNEDNIKWIPASNKGRSIDILYTLPVRFKL